MKKIRQRGSALVYILIAIALLAALTATFMDSSSQQTSSQNTFNIVSDLNSQINFIRSSIQECILTFPSGDTTMPVDPVGTNIGRFPTRPYPLIPTNNYLASPATGSSLARDVRCPGNPGNSNNHTRIFGGSSGKFMPPPPALFGDWFYHNDTDGVFFWSATNKTDAHLATALQKLDSQYSACETQYVDATSAAVNLRSDGNTGFRCLAGERCFVVRITTTGSTIYPGETTCP
jgi:hypothetical protein